MKNSIACLNGPDSDERDIIWIKRSFRLIVYRSYLSLVPNCPRNLYRSFPSIGPHRFCCGRIGYRTIFNSTNNRRCGIICGPNPSILHYIWFDVIASFLAASYPRWLSGEQLASALQDAETGIENEWIQRTNTSTAPCPIDVCHEQIICVRGAKLLLEGLLSEAIDRQYVHVDKSMTTTLGLINSADYFGDDDDDDDNLSAHATPLYSRWFPCCKRRRFSSSLRSTFGCGWLFPSSYR